MYDKYGFGPDGKHKDTRGFIDKRMFKKDRKHLWTGTLYDDDGYDIDGYNMFGFDIDKLHKKTHKRFDQHGFDREGYDEKGYNKQGFDRKGRHKGTGSEWNVRGIDANGKYNPIHDAHKNKPSDALCPICNGTGRVNIRDAHHQFGKEKTYQVMCIECLGTGRVIKGMWDN